MTPNTKYNEAIAYLEDRVNYETFRSIPHEAMENRLKILRDFLDFLDSPDKKYAVIHVAGTKGKGSTCIFLEQILREAGYRVGLFSSPHLHSLMERFTVDGNPCEESQFADILFDLKNRIELWERTSPIASQLQFPLTYFELTTVFAFEYFVRKNVDIAVIEVGLGGRLDSTNVCQPMVSIISSISHDHIAQLGPTLSDIAREKAGIIKPGVPMISGVRRPDPVDTIRTIAAERNAPLYELGRDFEPIFHPRSLHHSIVFDFATTSTKFAKAQRWTALESPIWGEHQSRNASLAIAAGILLEEQGWKIPEDAVRRGLQSVQLPARIEVWSQKPLMIVDAAHNRASVQELIETLKTHYHSENGRKILLFGSMLGKDNEGMLQELVQYFDWIVFTQHPINPRSFPAQGLYNIATSNLCHTREDFHACLLDSQDRPQELDACNIGEVIPDIAQALVRVKALAGADDLICTTGSFYLAAEIRKMSQERGAGCDS